MKLAIEPIKDNGIWYYNRTKTKHRMSRILKCDYCNRILPEDQANELPEKTKRVACTACGHGYCKEQNPRTNCFYCGKQIWENINPKARVMCSSCVVRQVAHIERLEKELGVQIRNTGDYARAIVHGEGLYCGRDLAKARKARGWGQRTMGDYLGCSQKTVSRMETGEYPISGDAQAFIYRGSES